MDISTFLAFDERFKLQGTEGVTLDSVDSISINPNFSSSVLHFFLLLYLGLGTTAPLSINPNFCSFRGSAPFPLFLVVVLWSHVESGVLAPAFVPPPSCRRCEIIRGGMEKYLTPMGPTPLHVNPIFEIGPVEPRFSEWLVFEGISVDEAGRQHYLDASVAYKRAALNAIDYLSKFGYSREQVYLLLSCCPCEGRISGIVDSPNAVATLAVPIAIFDQDVRPKLSGRVSVGPRVEKRLPDVLRCTYDGDLPVTKNLSRDPL